MRMISLPPRPRILVIRRDNIGDLVCTTPAIAALREHYPNSEIAALVNSYNSEVLQGNPNLDHVFVYQKLKHASGLVSRLIALRRRFQLVARIRRWKPDVTILAKAGYDQHGLKFARQICAKNVIGYVPDGLTQAKGLPDIQLLAPAFASLHEVEAINELLKPLAIYDALGPLQLFPNKNAVTQLKNFLPAAQERIALHISAREQTRRWGVENFIALSRYILEVRPDAQILLFWSPGKTDNPHHPGDDEMALQLIQAIQSNRLFPLHTQSLEELIAGISLCQMFIGSDGGAMHIAAGLGKAVLALFENLPDKLNHWYPWGRNSINIRSTNRLKPDVFNISLMDVIRGFDALYKKRVKVMIECQ